MHPNPIFHTETEARNIAFARDRGFGTLSINGDKGPLVSHIPFILNDDGTMAYGHLVRSNPVWRAIESAAPAVIAISGGDTYISPDWYGVPDQVPTWNYVAVHLRGTVERLPQDDLYDILSGTSSRFESELLPKPVWTMDKMTPDALTRMMRQIVPIRLRIESVDGTWKLSQNKTPASQAGVVDALETSPIGQNTAQIAQLMAAALKDETS